VAPERRGELMHRLLGAAVQAAHIAVRRTAGSSGAAGFRRTRASGAAATVEVASTGAHARSAAPADRRAVPQMPTRFRSEWDTLSASALCA